MGVRREAKAAAVPLLFPVLWLLLTSFANKAEVEAEEEDEPVPSGVRLTIRVAFRGGSSPAGKRTPASDHMSGSRAVRVRRKGGRTKLKSAHRAKIIQVTVIWGGIREAPWKRCSRTPTGADVKKAKIVNTWERTAALLVSCCDAVRRYTTPPPKQ